MGFFRKFKKVYFWLWFVWPFINKLMPRFKVYDPVETVQWLIRNKGSCVRLGDGEIGMMIDGSGPGYQKSSHELRKRLFEVLNKRDDKLLVCIPRAYQIDRIQGCTRRARKYWKAFVARTKDFAVDNFDQTYQYGDGQMSRPYMDTQNIEMCQKVFDGIKTIFKDQNIVIIEGSKTRLGVGNDLLAGAKSVKRIICPSGNAYEKSEEIFQEAINLPTDSLLIFAIGPASKPLIIDLFDKGYRSLDLGHFDIEYEWFLQRASKKSPVLGKDIANEVKSAVCNDGDIDLTQYEREIIARIE